MQIGGTLLLSSLLLVLLMLSRHTGHFYSFGQAGFTGDAAAPLEPAVTRCQLFDHFSPDLNEKERNKNEMKSIFNDLL
jgi:hypothetical protein